MNNLPPQYPPQQPPLNQTVQPTIRSGVSCRGCGIGIDPSGVSAQCVADKI